MCVVRFMHKYLIFLLKTPKNRHHGKLKSLVVPPPHRYLEMLHQTHPCSPLRQEEPLFSQIDLEAEDKKEKRKKEVTVKIKIAM